MIPFRLSPLGISINEQIPLTLIAEQAGSTVTLNATGSPTVSGLHYRLGKSGLWLPYTIGDTITLANVGDSVQFWNSADSLSTSGYDYVQFVMTGTISGKGNIQSLLDYSPSCLDYCFYHLFYGCTALTAAPSFPSMVIGYRCYSGAFRGTSIAEPPELPALNISSECYRGMFRACKSLTHAPDLPALALANSCYYDMFVECDHITSARIYAETLAASSCDSMFYGCSRLASVEVSFTEWLDGATRIWLVGVPGTGTFTKPISLPETRGTSNIPTGWTVVNK